MGHFLPVNDIFKIELSKFMYKFSKGLLPGSFDNYFERASSVHGHFTRLSKDNFFLPRTKKSIGLNCLSTIGVRLWHEIPDKIKEKNTVGTFLNLYKDFLKVEYFTHI